MYIYKHTLKHNICLLTASATIWAHMLSETLCHITWKSTIILFTCCFFCIAAAGAFFRLNIGKHEAKSYLSCLLSFS